MPYGFPRPTCLFITHLRSGDLSLQDLHDAAKGVAPKAKPAKRATYKTAKKTAAKVTKPGKVKRRMTQAQKVELVKKTTDFIKANPWKPKSEIGAAVGANPIQFNTVMRQLTKGKVIVTKGPRRGLSMGWLEPLRRLRRRQWHQRRRHRKDEKKGWFAGKERRHRRRGLRFWNR